jgi:Ni,Fe-hydrogenase III large subunit
MTNTGAQGIAQLAARLAPGADGYVRLTADEATWIALAAGCAEGLHDLSAIWLDDGQVRMALSDPAQRVRAIVSLGLRNGAYPSVSRHHTPAIRLERALRDLHGVSPEGLQDTRPWLDHGAWPAPPPHRNADGQDAAQPYQFLAAEGEGLHQIAVGPVHAGIIEPGHFRFTANGEAVVRLEQRLGYVHKGIEALCAGAEIERAARLAARISGDSTVAYSFAFARAVEAALDWQPPPRAVMLRGIMAELERLSHHVNDFGAVCNDASVVTINAWCTLIREDILQTADQCFGHRMMMDRIVPGGVAVDLDAAGITAIRKLLRRCESALRPAVRVYDRSPSLQDRTVSTGIVKADLARQFAAGGYIGRATGRAFDARAAFPYPPYDSVSFEVPTRTAGDVDARVWVRIEEMQQSTSIIRALLDRLPAGNVLAPQPRSAAGEGAALVEAFRGDAFVSVRLEEGRVARLYARDASWFQWPLLEAAIEGNIVADFPICNKSFNCSYSGHDM